MPRLLFSTFFFLLFTLSALTPTSLHAESSLIIKPDDNQVRATERLSDFLESIGYTVEYRDDDKDSLIIHQQQHRIHATLTVGENELTILTLAIHYKFKPKSGTREERALVANTINNRQYGIKVCFDEESNDLYFEYALSFDSYLVPRTMKRFADQAVATTYIMINSDKAINDAFFREKDSPDSARNADEVDAEEDGGKMDEEGEPAAPQSSVSPEPPSPRAPVPPAAEATQPSSQPAIQPHSSSLAPISPPSSPSSSTSTPVPPPSSLAPIGPSSSPSSSSPVPPSPCAPVPPPSSSLVPVGPPSSPSSSPTSPAPPPSSSLVPVNPPSSSSSSAPTAPSLQPALPPTTPASPAPSKKARA